MSSNEERIAKREWDNHLARQTNADGSSGSAYHPTRADMCYQCVRCEEWMALDTEVEPGAGICGLCKYFWDRELTNQILQYQEQKPWQDPNK